MTEKPENAGPGKDPGDEMSEYLQTFLDETEEQLDDLVDTMLVLENDSANREELNEAFRLIHSIKGSAGMMGFEAITVLTHHLENRFERFRSGKAELDEPTMNLVLRAIDFLRQCNRQLRRGETLASAAGLLDELEKLEERAEANNSFHPASRKPATPQSGSVDDDRRELKSESPQPAVPEMALTDDFKTHDDALRMLIRFRPGLQLIDLKARLIVNRLAAIADVKHTQPDINEETAFDHLEEFVILIESAVDLEKLRDVAGVSGVESIEFFEPASHDEWSASDQPRPVEATAQSQASTQPAEIGDAEPAGDVKHVAGDEKSDNAVAIADSAAPTQELVQATTDDIQFDTQAVTPTTSFQEVDRPQPSQPTAKSPKGGAKVAETMRIDIDRLDNLMNLAGELVVNRARFEQITDQLDPQLKKSTMRNRVRDFRESLRRAIATLENRHSLDEGLATEIQQLRAGLELMDQQSAIWDNGRHCIGQIGEAIDQLSRVSDSLQRGVLETRMVSVGPLFSRFRRVVRDLSKERDKEVNLVLRGEKTEMDKRLIDELGDPLVHLIRNSIDHGLETKERRLEAGKPKAGTICLEASHSGNNVYIQVSDDGAGIDVNKIKSRLVSNGVLTESAAAELSREQALDHIWDPGFSTAMEITDVSGRGVGMDVVKTRIRNLNGTVEIESTPGEGTCFTIRLPLTLAIINCLLVRLNDVVFSIPIDDVREIVSVKQNDIVSVLGKKTFEVRQQYLPLVDIDDVFHWNSCASIGHHPPANSRRETQEQNLDIVILRAAGKTIGLKVEEFLGGQDIVVKSLSDNFTSIRGLSGASILGDGSVSLMLDVGSLIKLANKSSAGSGTGDKEN